MGICKAVHDGDPAAKREIGISVELAEFNTKYKRLKGLLKAKGLGGILLSTRANFSWLTGGRTNHIRADVEKGAASLWVTPKGVELWCSNIEEKRFREEETTGFPLKLL